MVASVEQGAERGVLESGAQRVSPVLVKGCLRGWVAWVHGVGDVILYSVVIIIIAPQTFVVPFPSKYLKSCTSWFPVVGGSPVTSSGHQL